MQFDHERLDVYQVSIQFVSWANQLLDGPLDGKRGSVTKQLERASTLIPLNIAEGNGKPSRKDRSRYLNIARGSALESAACLDVIVARELLTRADVATGKGLLLRIVGMLTKLTARLLGQDAA
jgi:four helix bundle protein